MADRVKIYTPEVGKDLLDKANNRFSPNVWKYIDASLANQFGNDWRDKAKADIQANKPDKMSLFEHDNNDKNDLRKIINYFWSQNITEFAFQKILQANYDDFYRTLIRLKRKLNEIAHHNEELYQTSGRVNATLMSMLKIANLIGNSSLCSEIEQIKQELSLYQGISKANVSAESTDSNKVYPTFDDIVFNLTDYWSKHKELCKELQFEDEAKEVLNRIKESDSPNLFAIVGDVLKADLSIRPDFEGAIIENFSETLQLKNGPEFENYFDALISDIAYILLCDSEFAEHPYKNKQICILKSRLPEFTPVEPLVPVSAPRFLSSLEMHVLAYGASSHSNYVVAFNNQQLMASLKDGAADAFEILEGSLFSFIMTSKMAVFFGINSVSLCDVEFEGHAVESYQFLPLNSVKRYVAWSKQLSEELSPFVFSDDARKRLYDYLKRRHYADIEESGAVTSSLTVLDRAQSYYSSFPSTLLPLVKGMDRGLFNAISDKVINSIIRKYFPYDNVPNIPSEVAHDFHMLAIYCRLQLILLLGDLKDREGGAINKRINDEALDEVTKALAKEYNERISTEVRRHTTTEDIAKLALVHSERIRELVPDFFNLLVALVPELRTHKGFEQAKQIDLLAEIEPITEADIITIVDEKEKAQERYKEMLIEYARLNPLNKDISELPPPELLGQDKQQTEDGSDKVAVETAGDTPNDTANKEQAIENINRKLKGQEQVVAESVQAIVRGLSPLGKSADKPVASFIYAGTTGVGKTYLTKLLAQEFKYLYRRIDMSEFSESHTISRLIGSPPGYIGSESDSSQLERIIKENPKALIVFDEIEKANEQVINILLQILDNGKASTATGTEVDFTKAIIVCTTNAGATAIDKAKKTVGFTAHSPKSEPVDKSGARKELEKTFKPEWLNRFSKIFIFNAVSAESIKAIINNRKDEFVAECAKFGLQLTISDGVLSIIEKLCSDSKYGVRELDRNWGEIVQSNAIDSFEIGKRKQIAVVSTYTDEQIAEIDDEAALRESVFAEQILPEDDH